MADVPRMEVDVRSFGLSSTIDTCSVYNLFSSRRLLAATQARNTWFVVTDYVFYESVVRQRTLPTQSDAEIQKEFTRRLAQRKGFVREQLEVADLQAIANLPATRKLGRGEIAAMAVALRMRVGFTTDDQGARRAAQQAGVVPVQTIPHLVGWLVYCGELSDGDFADVVREHDASVPASRGRISDYMALTYNAACQFRYLRDSSPVQTVPEPAK
jgi:predicted nucleic acid-binding protein